MTLRNYTSLLAVMMLVCTLFNASAQCTPPPCGGRTQTQGGWGTNPNGNNPGTILQANFASAFPTGITIGCTNTLKLTTAAAVRNFLPQGSTPKALPAGVSINPTSTFKNVFAGQVVALTISLKFDATVAGFNTSGTPLKDQYVVSGLFAGWTVQQVYDEAVKKLGGCASPYTFAQLNDAISSINENYVDGTQNNGFLVCAPRVCCVSTDAVCCGCATGSVTVTAHGAAPISYAWSNGAISQNLVNVTAGIYTVTITDGIGLTSSTSCEVGQDQPLTATASSAGVSCYQACDGIVSINISGGAAPYVTQWSPSISNINNVCAGSYSYTVTDAHGCTVGGSVVVNEPAQLNVSASAMSPLCYGLTGSAS
ncbi:MAG TPA: hypothetical protein VEY71_00310, partial [Chitinophagales bacterium]|nr:hypothetical protein [Chitinophagales bacterium]